MPRVLLLPNLDSHVDNFPHEVVGEGDGMMLYQVTTVNTILRVGLQLPEGERDHYQAHLAALLLPKQEKDGSWWDYMLYDYHQQYGTAMALFTLSQALPEPAAQRQ